MPEALQSADDIKAAMMNLDGESSTPTPDGTQPTPAAAPAAPAEPQAAAPAAPAAPAEPAAPSADAEPEPDFETGDDLEGKDWKVPGEKLQAQVKRRKEAEQRAEEAEARVAALEAAKDKPADDPAPDPDADDDDVEVDPVLLKALKKQGYLTRAEAEKLAEEKATGVLSADKATAARQQQAVQDRQELTKEFSDKGYPAFDIKSVLPKAIEMVGEKNISKEILRAAYIEQNAQEIQNIVIKQANATTTTPSASAERSGGAPKAGTSTETTPQNTPDKIKAGIAAAIPD